MSYTSSNSDAPAAPRTLRPYHALPSPDFLTKPRLVVDQCGFVDEAAKRLDAWPVHGRKFCVDGGRRNLRGRRRAKKMLGRCGPLESRPIPPRARSIVGRHSPARGRHAEVIQRRDFRERLHFLMGMRQAAIWDVSADLDDVGGKFWMLKVEYVGREETDRRSDVISPPRPSDHRGSAYRGGGRSDNLPRSSQPGPMMFHVPISRAGLAPDRSARCAL
jgi:hypothetical protein